MTLARNSRCRIQHRQRLRRRLGSFLLGLLLIVGLSGCPQDSTTQSSPTLGSAPVQAEASGPMQLGIQASSTADWEPAVIYKNLIKQSRRWWIEALKDFEDPSPIERTDREFFTNLRKRWFQPDGYPRQVPFTDPDYVNPATGKPYPLVPVTMMQLTDGRYPGGTYTLRFTGKGRVKVWMDGNVELESSGSTVSKTFAVKPRKGLWLIILESDAADPVHDLQVIVPGYENDDLKADPLYPEYLDRLKGFAFIRFFGNANKPIVDKDMEETVPIVSWADRLHLEDLRYPFVNGGRGKGWGDGWPLENMARLVNAVKADLWWSTGYAIDDDYVRQAAKLFREQLDPDRKIYLEYSNEIWNEMFAQSRYATEQGLAQGLGGYKQEAEQAKINFTVKRSIEIFQIFREAFGDNDRVITVLSGWQNRPSYNQRLLAALDDPKINPTGFRPNAFATAPYFDAGRKISIDKLPAPTVGGVLQASEKLIQGRDSKSEENIALIRQAGLLPLVYESGQHLVQSNDPALTKLFVEANRHPKMAELYRQYYDRLERLGYRGAVHFKYVSAFGRHGSWGALEYLSQPLAEAHKYRALREWLAERSGTPSPT